MNTASGTKNTLTIKGLTSTSGIARNEYETELSKTDSINLFKICHKPIIEKLDSYIHRGVKREFYMFFGENRGLLIEEIKLKSKS